MVLFEDGGLITKALGHACRFLVGSKLAATLSVGAMVLFSSTALASNNENKNTTLIFNGFYVRATPYVKQGTPATYVRWRSLVFLKLASPRGIEPRSPA